MIKNFCVSTISSLTRETAFAAGLIVETFDAIFFIVYGDFSVLFDFKAVERAILSLKEVIGFR